MLEVAQVVANDDEVKKLLVLDREVLHGGAISSDSERVRLVYARRDISESIAIVPAERRWLFRQFVS